MTYARKPGSLEAAITEAIHLLGVELIEKLTDKDVKVFRRAANPMELDRTINMKDAAKLEAALRASGHQGIFEQLFTEHVESLLADYGGEQWAVLSPSERITHIAAEFGDVAREIHRGVDGSNSLKKELLELRDAVDGALKDVDAREKMGVTQLRKAE